MVGKLFFPLPALKGVIMFGKIVAVLLIVGLIALSTYWIVGLVRAIKERKNAKSDKKE